MEEKVQGLVVGSVNYGDNDKILRIFTLEKGTVSARIKGVKKSGAKLKFAAEPFCLAEFTFTRIGDKRTVTGASLIDSFYPLREDLVKLFCGGTVSEFVKRFAKEEIISGGLFIDAVNALKLIAYGGEPPRSVLVGFLLESLKTVGYALDLKGCFKCGKELDGRVFFDFTTGGFFCEECRENGARKINLSTYDALCAVENGQTIPDDMAFRALRLLDYYLVNKTEESLTNLKELLKLTPTSAE